MPQAVLKHLPFLFLTPQPLLFLYTRSVHNARHNVAQKTLNSISGGASPTCCCWSAALGPLPPTLMLPMKRAKSSICVSILMNPDRSNICCSTPLVLPSRLKFGCVVWIILAVDPELFCTSTLTWLNFSSSNSRVLLPTFSTNCPDESHFAQIGSQFAQNTTPKPCFLLSCHTLLSGICTYTEQPQTHLKIPLFLAWTWKWAKWTTVTDWAIWTPTGQNVLKVDKPFTAWLLQNAKTNYKWRLSVYFKISLKLSNFNLAIDFEVKTCDCLVKYPLGVIARWQAGAQTWTQTWTLQRDQQVVKFLSALKSLNRLCGTWILFRSTEDTQIEASQQTISTLIPPSQNGSNCFKCDFERTLTRSKQPSTVGILPR